MRISSFLPLLVIALLVPACGTEKPQADLSYKDVLLYVVDTLRADHLGCYGYHLKTSPVMDGLARGGVRAADCTAQAPWTGPSMVSMLVSRYTTGEFVRMPPEITMAQIFADAGYRTVGVQYNPMLFSKSGFENGFHVYLDGPGMEELKKEIKADPSKPLFLYVHVIHPHLPYKPIDSCNIFEPEPVTPEQQNVYLQYLKENFPNVKHRFLVEEVEKATAHTSKMIALYDGSILQSDRFLKHLLNELNRRKETLVVVASDHGEGLFEHLELNVLREMDESKNRVINAFKNGHNSLLNREMVDVPLIFHGPGVPEGVVLEGPVENVDLLPTVLDLVGLDKPENLDGRSLVPLMEDAAAGRRPEGRQVVFSSSKYHTSARMQNGKKLIYPWLPNQRDGASFFHLEEDPMERTSLPLEGQKYDGLKEIIQGFRQASLRPTGGEDAMDALVRKRFKELGYL